MYCSCLKSLSAAFVAVTSGSHRSAINYTDCVAIFSDNSNSQVTVALSEYIMFIIFMLKYLKQTVILHDKLLDIDAGLLQSNSPIIMVDLV
jgi:hypothetical protein